MAICLNLNEPVVLLLLIVITSVLSGDLMQLLETLKEDAKNSDESNKFIRTVLEHKNDLEWIENLGHQYRGIRDTLQTEEDLVDCNWNPLNSDQYARRIPERGNNYKYKFRQNNNRYSPYAFSPYSSSDDYGRDKRQLFRYEYRPQIQVRNNGLTGVLRPHNLKHVPRKRKSDNINDAEEQKVINIDHEKELEKLESKAREEYHDILGLRDYSQKEAIMEENKEYLKTSTAVSESHHKNRRYGNTFDSNENILFPKWNRMLKKSTDYYNSNSDCDNGKCANVNNDKMDVGDIDIPERNTGNDDIVQAVFDPECTSCASDNTNQFQIMVLPESVTTRVNEINPTLSPIVFPVIMKSQIPVELDFNSEQDTHKIIQKKEVAANHSSLTEVPFVTIPPIDIIHSKNYHNFVPEKDIYIDTNKFNANTEENIFKDILETEKYVPEYGPLHIARLQPATAEPAHVFSFEYSSQKAMEDTLNEMTEEEKRKAAVEAHKLMEVDKEFNERNEPELDATSDIDLSETKDSKSNTQNSDVNFKSRSLKYIDMDREEGPYLPYLDYDNNYRYVNRHTKRSNAKEVIQNGLKKLKKIFGFGNDKVDYEEVTDVYPFDEGQSNIINEDFNDYEYVPKHRDRTVHRKYHRKKEGNANRKYIKGHKSPRFTHQNRKHFVDIRKKYKADECTESTPKTSTACITTSTTPSTTTTKTTTACTTPTTTPSTTTTIQKTTACATPSTTTSSSATCTNTVNPAATISNMEVIDEKEDDYLADENEEEACTEPTTEHIHFGPTANVSCEVTPNKKEQETQIKNNEDLINVTDAEHSTIASATTENLAITTVSEMTSPIGNTEVSSITTSESTTATVSVTATSTSSGESVTEISGASGTTGSEVAGTIVSEAAPTEHPGATSATGSEATSTTGSETTSTTGFEVTSTIVSESAGTTVSEATSTIVSELAGTTVSEAVTNRVSEIGPTTVSVEAETTVSELTTIAASTTPISEIATTHPETSTVSNEATVSHEHTTPNVMPTEHTNTNETTTHQTATTVSSGKHITENEHEHKSNKPIVEGFPEDLSMDKKLHGQTTEVPHTTSHEGNVTHVGMHGTIASEEDVTECTETDDETKRKRKKSVHEAVEAKRNILHSENFSKSYSKRSDNNKHVQRKNPHITYPRISKKHHKKNNKNINRHRKRALDTISKQNNDENEDMDQEKLRTIPVSTNYNNNEDVDVMENNGKIRPRRTNNFRYSANRYGPNKFSLNRYIPRDKRHHSEHYNNYHPKIRTRRSNHMLPANRYSSSQYNIMSQETAQDVEDDDLNYFMPDEFESKHFKKPFAPEQLNENINYKEIKNGVSQQKNTRHVGGRSMQLSKRNYDANFQQISAENMNRRNRMDVNNEGKHEHSTTARDTSYNDGSIDTHLKDEALKGQLAAQIVESIFNEVDNSGQLKKHISPGLDKGHKTKPVSNQGKSDKHQNEEEEKQLENMQQSIMKSLNKLIAEQIELKTCEPLDPESTVFLEQLTNKQNNLAKSYETERDMKATDKPPHQEIFLFEEPKKAKGNNNNTHLAITAVPGEHTTLEVHNKQTTQNVNHTERTNQNEVTTQHGLTTELNTRNENRQSTENEQHTELNTEHISQVTTHPTILQSPISQNELDKKAESTTCDKDAEIDIFAPEHDASFHSGSPHTVSTEKGFTTERELATEHGPSTEHERATEHRLSREHGFLIEHRLVIEHELSTVHRLLVERELSTEHGGLKEHELSTESSTANTDTKEMEEKKERVKRLMEMYNELPQNDRHKFCKVYQYLHKQNIFLDRVMRQIKKSTRSARYSQEYFENRRRRYPFYEYPRNEYVPRHYQQYVKPRHQIWSQQYVSNDQQTPSDKYMKLVKRAMYYRRKREAEEERLSKQITMNTTGDIKKLPAVTTEGMEDLTFNYSNN